MKNLIRILVGVVALLAAASLAAPANAVNSGYDGDTRHCMTAREVFLIGPDNGGNLTRAQAEQRWEVTGLGHRGQVTPIGVRGYLYKMCDNDPRVAFAAFRNGHLWVWGVWKHEGPDRVTRLATA